jgi:hypothetical protein
LRASVLICFVLCFWLLGVCRTVREESADSRFRAGGLRVGHKKSVFWATVLEVRGYFRTIRPVLADC